jgi:Ala-tRNA(Pro) deacylase
MRFSDFLSDQGIPFETLLHPPAFTAQRRAKYLGVPGRQVAKSVLLVGPQGYVLAVLPATHRLDTEALARQLGGAVRLAQEGEIAAVFPDCEWGLVAPFGSLYGLPTILDDSLASQPEIVLESQTRATAIRMRCRDFERLVQPRRLPVARPHASFGLAGPKRRPAANPISL